MGFPACHRIVLASHHNNPKRRAHANTAQKLQGKPIGVMAERQ
jgi:hypothetical protein